MNYPLISSPRLSSARKSSGTNQTLRNYSSIKSPSSSRKNWNYYSFNLKNLMFPEKT